MASYRLKGVYFDPDTGKRYGPGDVVDLSDDEANRLRYMLADPKADDADAPSIAETDEAAERPKARKRTS